MGKINAGKKVWVDMSDRPVSVAPHESGYAVVVEIVENAPNLCYVEFLDMDKPILVDVNQLTLTGEKVDMPKDTKEDTPKDTMHDKHYRNAIVEPILVMQNFFSHEELIGFLKGNILKYRIRAGHKGTDEEMRADWDKIRVYEKWLDAVKNGERIEL